MSRALGASGSFWTSWIAFLSMELLFCDQAGTRITGISIVLACHTWGGASAPWVFAEGKKIALDL